MYPDTRTASVKQETSHCIILGLFRLTKRERENVTDCQRVNMTQKTEIQLKHKGDFDFWLSRFFFLSVDEPRRVDWANITEITRIVMSLYTSHLTSLYYYTNINITSNNLVCTSASGSDCLLSYSGYSSNSLFNCQDYWRKKAFLIKTYKNNKIHKGKRRL